MKTFFYLIILCIALLFIGCGDKLYKFGDISQNLPLPMSLRERVRYVGIESLDISKLPGHIIYVIGSKRNVVDIEYRRKKRKKLKKDLRKLESKLKKKNKEINSNYNDIAKLEKKAKNNKKNNFTKKLNEEQEKLKKLKGEQSTIQDQVTDTKELLNELKSELFDLPKAKTILDRKFVKSKDYEPKLETLETLRYQSKISNEGKATLKLFTLTTNIKNTQRIEAVVTDVAKSEIPDQFIDYISLNKVAQENNPIPITLRRRYSEVDIERYYIKAVIKATVIYKIFNEINKEASVVGGTAFSVNGSVYSSGSGYSLDIFVGLVLKPIMNYGVNTPGSEIKIPLKEVFKKRYSMLNKFTITSIEKLR